MNPLVYQHYTDGDYNFSATQVERFFSHPSSIYDEVFLQKKTFLGNNQTIIGTIVHYIASEFIKNKYNFDNSFRGMIEANIAEYIQLQPKDLELDLVYIEKWRDMVNILLPYLKENIKANECISEERLTVSLNNSPSINFNGTLDLRDSNTLYDFKTTSKFSDIVEIPSNYRTQLYCYCFLMEMNNLPLPDSICNIYIHIPEVGRISEKTGKPMKDYPCKVYPISEKFNFNEYEIVKQKIYMLRDAINVSSTNDELSRLIFRRIENVDRG